MTRQFNSEAMDQAARQAKTAFNEMLKPLSDTELETVRKLADWWQAHFMTAGHKRLARILLTLTHNELSHEDN